MAKPEGERFMHTLQPTMLPVEAHLREGGPHRITPEIPSEEKRISGFEIAFALAAIFAVARMRGRRRK